MSEDYSSSSESEYTSEEEQPKISKTKKKSAPKPKKAKQKVEAEEEKPTKKSKHKKHEVNNDELDIIGKSILSGARRIKRVSGLSHSQAVAKSVQLFNRAARNK